MDITLSTRSEQFVISRHGEYKEKFWEELHWFLSQLEFYFRYEMKKQARGLELQLLDLICKTFNYFRSARVATIKQDVDVVDPKQVLQTELAQFVVELFAQQPIQNLQNSLSISQTLSSVKSALE